MYETGRLLRGDCKFKFINIIFLHQEKQVNLDNCIDGSLIEFQYQLSTCNIVVSWGVSIIGNNLVYNSTIKLAYTMSSTDVTDIILCATCGKEEDEDNNLKACTACKIVKYCNRDCQIAHRTQHKKTCKKRAEELLSRR